MLEKIQQNERVRKELQHVRKEAKAKAKKVAFKVPQLKDSKYHPTKDKKSKAGQENMLFITEGQSAAGSIVTARDPMTQAVFSLKGKPMNVFGQSLPLLYKNEEMYNLMQSLNIEESVGNLRFDKVILATDADVANAGRADQRERAAATRDARPRRRQDHHRNGRHRFGVVRSRARRDSARARSRAAAPRRTRAVFAAGGGVRRLAQRDVAAGTGVDQVGGSQRRWRRTR
jgi:hypothetical protein